MSENRELPKSLEAERSVLGVILFEGSVIDDVMPILAERDFSEEKHRRIYRAMVELAKDKAAVGLLTVKEALSRNGGLDAAGGPLYLSKLISGPRDMDAVEDHARIVKDKATRRRLIERAQKLGQDARSEDKSIATLFEEARVGLADLEAAGEPKAKWASPAGVLRDSPLRNSPRVRTGLGRLDEATGGGLPIGSVIVLSGAPGSGKTTLAIQIARAAREQLGARVIGYFGDEGLEGAAGKLGQQIGLQREDLDAGEENALASLQAYTAGDGGENL